MILYLDTSALLKLYLTESDSDRMQRAIKSAEATYTHLITYAEMRAAFAQAVRMKRLSKAARTRQVREFDADWTAIHVISVDDPLVRRAADHAERFGLRGYDSVHLAAAERVFEASARSPMFALAAFDIDLCAGAHALGMKVLN